MSSFRKYNRQQKKTVPPIAQLTTNSEQKVKNALENYLIEQRRNRQITAEELEEYTQAQRDQIDEINRIFGISKHDQKVEPPIFTLAKIEHVVSARDFYAVQICDLEARTEFQNILNRAYEDDCEPIDNVKAKDLCMVMHDYNWYRGEVVEIVIECIGKIRAIVYLLDYGRAICTKKKHLYMIKQPHNCIKPFVIKCQLSIINTDEEELSDQTKYSLAKEFENISQSTDQFLLYLNRLDPDKGDVYNVMLLSDVKTDLNTIYGAYLLHEVYGAFVRPNVQFENEIGEEWSRKILQMTSQSSNDHTKKIQVYISHIGSPTEIYVHCKAARAFMNKIRRIIDAYMKITANTDHNTDGWSIGMDCLVRLQNWKTECNLKQWYRGRIIDKNENLFTVFLRDYGRTAKVNCIDLTSISPQLAAPANAVQKCSLAISNTWIESSTCLLRKIVDEYEYFAISSVTKSESNLFVALWATNYPPNEDDGIGTFELWDNIGLRIISQSIIESMELFIKKSQRRYDKVQSRKNDNFCFDSDVSEYSDDNNTLEELNFEEYDLLDDSKPVELFNNSEDDDDDLSFQQALVPMWQPPLPVVREVFNGIVTHITKKGIIYVQEESYNEAAYQLGQSITDHLKRVKYSEGKNYIWHEGEPCFAEYDFANYHRAVIKKINREDGTCLIKYVDYGDKAVMKLDDLCPATGFGDIPSLVNKFFVPKLVPLAKNAKWCKMVMTEFKSRLQNEMCVICIDNTTISGYENNRILPCSIEPHILPCDIYKWLLKKNLGYNTGLNENDQDVLFI